MKSEAAPGMTAAAPRVSLPHYPAVPDFLVMLFCGYVVQWYLQLGKRVPALGAVRFEFLLGAFLFLLSLACTPKMERKCPVFLHITLFFLALAGSVAFSYDFNHSLDIFTDRVLKFSCMAWFIIAFVRTPRHLKYFMAAFLLACFKMGAEGFWGRISGSMMWENQGVMRLHGTTDLYGHPNSFAGMALGTLPFVFAYWPLANKYLKAFLLTLGVFSLNIIVYSASRTGYIGFLFFCVLQVCSKRVKKRAVVVVLTLGLCLLPLVPQQYAERFHSIFTQQEKEGRSSEKRIEILHDAVQIFLDHPFGVGVQAFPKVREQYFQRTQDTHNLYLEILTNLGVQGMLIFCLLIGRLMAMLRRTRRSLKTLADTNTAVLTGKGGTEGMRKAASENLRDIGFAAATVTAVRDFVLVRLVLGLFGMDLYEIYWWFALGTSVSLYGINKTLAAKTAELSRQHLCHAGATAAGSPEGSPRPAGGRAYKREDDGAQGHGKA